MGCNKCFFPIFCIISILVSGLVGGIYTFLFHIGYFPNVSVTVWIGLFISVLLLFLLIKKILFTESSGNAYFISTLIGVFGTIGFTMLALSGFMCKDADPPLVLLYGSAALFAFTLIQLLAYVQHKRRHCISV